MSRKPKVWKSFKEARSWVWNHEPRFKNAKEFKEAWMRREIPLDIPSNPNIVYANSGWRGIRDFLGTESPPYWSFEVARNWAHAQRDSGMVLFASEWAALRRQGDVPQEIPSSPNRVYLGAGWEGWENFLGRYDGRCSKFERILAIELARYFDSVAGQVKVQLPTGRSKRVDILLTARQVVVECDGAFFHKNRFAEDCAETLALSEAGYRVVRVREQSPQYALEAVTPGLDLLLLASLKPREKVFRVLSHLVEVGVLDGSHLERIEAERGVVHACLAGDAHAPASFVSFIYARQVARTLKLPNKRAWDKFTRSSAFKAKRFARVPASPPSAYGKEFLGWGDFLGTGNLRPSDKKFISYGEAKRLIAKISPRITGERAFRVALRTGRVPSLVPRNPSVHYGNRGWISWGDFLGTGNLRYGRRSFLPHDEAKHFVKMHLSDVRTCAQWNLAVKDGRVPTNIPRGPHMVYRGQGWDSWGDFLGTGRKKHQRKPFASYEEAKRFREKTCPEITTRSGWVKGRATGRIPPHFPSNPWNAYCGRGWKGIEDFFGRK